MVERERLLQMVDFCVQAANMSSRSAMHLADVTQASFVLTEDALHRLPGVRVNVDHEDPAWLQLDRLRETPPPDVSTRWASSIDASSVPTVPPKLRAAHPPDPPLSAYFEQYVTQWNAWAKTEVRIRESIALYKQLYQIKQTLEGAIGDAQRELVWGAGIVVWSIDGQTMRVPLLTHALDVALHPQTAAIVLRPRDVDTGCDLDAFAEDTHTGIIAIEQFAKKMMAQDDWSFSPFEPNLWTPLLKQAATHLASNGVYWSGAHPDDRTVPKPESYPKVTNTWVVFLRPKTNNMHVQDLLRLRTAIEQTEQLPPVAHALTTPPDMHNTEVHFPAMRGMCGNNPSGEDVFFPKPYNDEQVRMVQLLHAHTGVVVQGPPGTGKTHTIANIVCHYLAHGKRILITSMKDAALSVLRDQLPEPIRPLAIALLTMEHEGKKQFEQSIHHIATIVQTTDRVLGQQQVDQEQARIDALHARMAALDAAINGWAHDQLQHIVLDGQDVSPERAAQWVATYDISIIPDPIDARAEHAFPCSDEEVRSLRSARTELGVDIDYCGVHLPVPSELPSAARMRETHQKLSLAAHMHADVEAGIVPPLRDTSDAAIATLVACAQHIASYEQARHDVSLAKQAHPWLQHVQNVWQRTQARPLVAVAQALIADIRALAQRRPYFLERPITAPSELFSDAALAAAVQLLAQGKQPFGLFGMLGKKHHKQQLAAVRIVGAPPQQPEQWAYVASYIDWHQRGVAVTVRWAALAPDFGWPDAFPTPFGVFDAAQAVHALDEYATRKSQLIDDARTMFAWTGQDVTDKYDVFRNAVQHHMQTTDLARSWETKQQCFSALDGCTGRITERIRTCVQTMLGSAHTTEQQWQSEWNCCMDELHRVRALHAVYEHVGALCDRIAQAGGTQYARILKKPGEAILPDDIRAIWNAKRLETELARREGKQSLHDLAQERRRTEEALAEAYRTLVVLRTHLSLAIAATPAVRAALQAYRNAINKIGKGTGKRAARYRHDARNASKQATDAIPCWIMPHDRVCESLPAQLGCFDLVIIDEASQSDITAVPSLLRAKKVLIVGDDKQVSPDGIGLEEEKMQHIMQRFLHNQVEAYRAQFAPDRSVYDLCKVVFAHSTVMLREHFRCVSPIIEYSKREFYNHELRPLRVPKPSERLDPPLIDVYVKDGFRKGDVNIPEAHFIVEEIKRMIGDERYAHRTIGVVSLLGFAQAQYVYQRIVDTIGIEAIERHAIACGDARTFQGKERDVVFLSLVAAANEKSITAMTRDAYAQRFNVAASRARDQMILVRSCTPDQLSEKDVLRRGLIAHFAAPFLVDEHHATHMRKQCESDFERAVYDVLIERGYRVRTQVRVGNYRIDIVVEGDNDKRIAIECDGDAFHGPDRWEADIRRQRVLERAGWTFWRCFASTWIRKRRETIDHLIQTLTHHNIHPSAQNDVPSPNTAHRIVEGMR